MKFGLKTSRLLCCIVFALPLGFDPSNSESRQFTFGAQGGAGRAVSILQNCAGQTVQKAVIDYEDLGLSASMRQRLDNNADLVLGVRGGWYGTGDTRFDQTHGRARETHGRYLNPHVGLDYPYVGASIGIITGSVPVSPNDLRRNSGDETMPSFHVRFGRLDRLYIKAGVGENLPLYSGGGVVDIGLGYQAGSSAHMFSGISGGPSGGVGFLHQVQLGHQNAPLDLLVSLRLGAYEGTSENAASLGIAYTP